MSGFAPEASLLDARLDRALRQLRESDLYRTRRIVEGAHGVDLVVDGRRCINFCSNDYLGLAGDARVAAAARRVLDRCGTGTGAAALVSGYNREHAQLEEALAAVAGRPRALLFSSGWAANLGTLRALFGRGDHLVCDELNHASLIDGARLAGARYWRVPHADLGACAAALAEAGALGGELGVVTDRVFSMDGDEADVAALAALARPRGATLIVDDAHGFGLGPSDRPAAPAGAEVYIATLGKSLGAAGAFVAGSEALIEFLIQRARTWVFSTAPPPALAAAAHAALRIILDEPERRQRLQANIERFRRGIAALGTDAGFEVLPSATPIQPLLVGDAAAALGLSQRLQGRGFWVAAIRPPTVPPGTSRLRITLSAAHEPAQIDALLQALAEQADDPVATADGIGREPQTEDA